MEPAQGLLQSKHLMNLTSVEQRSLRCRAQDFGNLQCNKIQKGMASIADLSARNGLQKRSFRCHRQKLNFLYLILQLTVSLIDEMKARGATSKQVNPS